MIKTIRENHDLMCEARTLLYDIRLGKEVPWVYTQFLNATLHTLNRLIESIQKEYRDEVF